MKDFPVLRQLSVGAANGARLKALNAKTLAVRQFGFV